MRLADSTVAGGEIARGANGLALLCGAGEAGELLGLVNQRDAARNFAGYTDAAATRRRLVRDVLKRGDCWFRTGDLLRTDAEGFVYFVDRLGDTFRYKGENVRPQGARVPCPRSQQPPPSAAGRHSRGPLPCAGPPIGSERRALASWMPKGAALWCAHWRPPKAAGFTAVDYLGCLAPQSR